MVQETTEFQQSWLISGPRRPRTFLDCRLSLGVYPGVSLKAARKELAAARKLLAAGVAPSENRKATKLFGRDLFPPLGDKSIASIVAPEVLAVP